MFRKALLLGGLFVCLNSGVCLAANANNPYGNIDRSNDAGNDTGDARVEALNQAQLAQGGIRIDRRQALRAYPNPNRPAYAYPPSYPGTRGYYPPPVPPPPPGYYPD